MVHTRTARSTLARMGPTLTGGEAHNAAPRTTAVAFRDAATAACSLAARSPRRSDPARGI